MNYVIDTLVVKEIELSVLENGEKLVILIAPHKRAFAKSHGFTEKLT